MKHISIVLLFAVSAALFSGGCQKSDASQIRQARRIVSENLKLQEQLKEKDRQIEDLKKQIETIEAERAKADEEYGNSTIKTLQMLGEVDAQNQALTAENEKLKKELAAQKTQ